MRGRVSGDRGVESRATRRGGPGPAAAEGDGEEAAEAEAGGGAQQEAAEREQPAGPARTTTVEAVGGVGYGGD